MHPRRPPLRLRRPRQFAAVPPPGAWYEVSLADPCRGRAAETAAGEDAARGAARRMSAAGALVDITLVLGDGTRLPVASFAGGQPLPGAAARVPAAADAAQAPVSRLRGAGNDRAAALRYPGGIFPLPVAATCGGLPRPHRLLHPDGIRLVCRPQGRSGRRWAGVADGVVPGSGSPAGWLQVVRRDRTADPAGLVTLHPALISPAGVDPFARMNRRQRLRFSEFDVAEAAGLPAARLHADLIDAGDFIVIPGGRDDIVQVSQAALICGAAGVSVRLLADRLGQEPDVPACGEADLLFQAADLVDVLIPARHPAEAGPQAWRLFAPGWPGRVIRVPPPVLLWNGGR